MQSCPSFMCYTYRSPYGSFCLQASAKGITAVSFDNQELKGKELATALMNQAASELQEYLAGKRKDFKVALDMQGTPFQKAVWTEICHVPYGHIITATDIADRIEKPGSYRNVGSAIKQCILAPFVPVHRIENVSTNGPRAQLYRAFQTLEQRVMSTF